MLNRHPVLWYVVIIVAFSFATYFLPLPVEQSSLLVPVLMVFIPTIVSILMAVVTEGRDGIRQMLSTASLRRGGVKWLLIGAGSWCTGPCDRLGDRNFVSNADKG